MILNTPIVTAVILNTNAARDTLRCVAALRAQTIADQLEIIVIENHSEDDSLGLLDNTLRGVPNVRIVETVGNHGYGHGYNTGMRYARGRYVLVNNPVKILPSDGIERFVARLESDPSIGLVAPQLRHPDGSLRFVARRYPRPIDLITKRTALGRWFPKRLRRYLNLDADPKQVRDVEWVACGCYMLPRSLFMDLRGFDERFFLFFEDTDLCRRVRLAGYRVVYDPTVSGNDRKRRLSEGGLGTLLFTRFGRAHIHSAFRYFAKWGMNP